MSLKEEEKVLVQIQVKTKRFHLRLTQCKTREEWGFCQTNEETNYTETDTAVTALASS